MVTPLRISDLLGLMLVVSGSLTAQTNCHAVPEQYQKTVQWTAGAGVIKFSADTFDCTPKAEGVSWLSVSVLPPGSGDPARTLKYSADSNFAPRQREGKIKLGDTEITIVQEPGPRPAMSFSPSKLEFAPKLAEAHGDISKTIFVGSSEALVFTASPNDAAWLSVKPERESKTPLKQQKFVVTVHADKLQPGVHKASITLEAEGATNAKELIPVTVEIGSK